MEAAWIDDSNATDAWNTFLVSSDDQKEAVKAYADRHQQLDQRILVVEGEKNIDIKIPVRFNCRSEREILVLLMYLKLGTWLLSWSKGIFRADHFNDVFAYSRKLTGFPGEAFFNVLLGNLVRYEKNQWIGGVRNDFLTTPPYKGLLVLSYTPILFLKAGKRNQSSGDEKVRKIEVEWPDHIQNDAVFQGQIRNFIKAVDEMAAWYYQHHIWHYLNATWKIDSKDHQCPLLYGIAGWSLRKTIKDLYGDEPEKISEAREDFKKQLRRFVEVSPLSQKTPMRRIAIFTDYALSHKGLTSVVLGQDHGVKTKPPQRQGSWEQICDWFEGFEVATERAQIKTLWEPTLNVPLTAPTDQESAQGWKTIKVNDQVEKITAYELLDLAHFDSWFDAWYDSEAAS
jgi:hypothetical protein